jgi:SOS-response transcriptional repressor LexA
MKPLTQRQKTVLDFIGEYRARQGFPPTLREIGEGIGLPKDGKTNEILSY